MWEVPCWLIFLTGGGVIGETREDKMGPRTRPACDWNDLVIVSNWMMGSGRKRFTQCVVWCFGCFESERKWLGMAWDSFSGVMTGESLNVVGEWWCCGHISSKAGLRLQSSQKPPGCAFNFTEKALSTTTVDVYTYCVLLENKPALKRPLTSSRRQTTSVWNSFVWAETIKWPRGLSETYAIQNMSRKTDEEIGKAVRGKVRRTVDERGSEIDWKGQLT